MTETPEETALYHVYGKADLLLYIGISNDFGRRWKEHAKLQLWWPERRRMTVDEWFPSRAKAEAAEKAAIKAEHPKYNKVHAVKLRMQESVVVQVTQRPLATAAEVAAYLEMPETDLATLRRRDAGPACRMLGRTPRYHWSDVEEWLAEHPGADYKPPRRAVRQRAECQAPARPRRRAGGREVPQGKAVSELRTIALDALEDVFAA